VYFLVRTSDESTDKFEQSVVWYQWNNHEIFKILVKRVASFFGEHIVDGTLNALNQSQLALYLDKIMIPTFLGKGHWANAPMYKVLLSLIRKRPRDIIKLCSGAGRIAYSRGSDLISTDDLTDSFPNYSKERLQDTINEFKTELPNIEHLLLGMKPSKKERRAIEGYTYTTDKLLEKIRTIQNNAHFKLAGRPITDAKALAQFMYKICFITARKELDNGSIDRKYFDDNPYLFNEFRDFGYDWEIHPAYRWALQPETIHDIFDQLKLSSG
jgi:hypothetical protein